MSRAAVRRAAPIVVACCLIGVACGKKDADDEAKAAEGGAAVSARIAVVSTQSFTEMLGTIGTVVPRAGHLATLSAPAPGRIANVLVTTGSHVTRGQALIELETGLFRAAAQSAEAALVAAQQSHDRTQRLANEGIAPRKDVETASAELAKARVDVATARRNEQLATLRSPIAGVVTRMSASLGATADPSQALVEIADPSSLDVLLSATPSDAARIRPGARVQLSAGQSAKGESLGIGTVVDVGGTVDTATRSVAVRVQAPTTRRPLRISETVFGQIALTTHASAIVVPSEALVPEGDGYKVFVVDAGGRAHAREVKVGGRSDAVAEITEGLVAGERIVTYGAFGMEDSVKVVQMDRAPATVVAPAPVVEKK